MIAASLEITRSGIVFAAAHVFNSLDEHHETRSSRKFLPTENPEGPLQKGGIKWDFSQANKYLPPFLKGDRGGFCCAVVFPKITAAYSLHKQRLTIPPAQQVGFKTTK